MGRCLPVPRPGGTRYGPRPGGTRYGPRPGGTRYGPRPGGTRYGATPQRANPTPGARRHGHPRCLPVPRPGGTRYVATPLRSASRPLTTQAQALRDAGATNNGLPQAGDTGGNLFGGRMREVEPERAHATTIGIERFTGDKGYLLL